MRQSNSRLRRGGSDEIEFQILQLSKIIMFLLFFPYSQKLGQAVSIEFQIEYFSFLWWSFLHRRWV